MLHGPEGKDFSHAKTQRRKESLKTRQRFAPLRLCARNLLHTGTLRARPVTLVTLKKRNLSSIVTQFELSGAKVPMFCSQPQWVN
jgi:hypothetical protein